mmetsp:Transcript_7607/g.25006  ORF Transcript_7607/g.25006 Transcript_7607/m.25006 type:complete len:220 (+) Transcript_7607:928-1587(+)
MREPRKKLCRVGMGRGGVQVGGARLDHVDQDDRQLGGRASPAADGRLGQPCPPVHSADGAGCGSWLRHCDGRSQLGLGRPFVGRGTECMEERLRGGSVLIAAARAHKTPERTSGQRHSGPSVDKGLLEKRHQPETRRLAGRGDKAPDRIPRRWQEPGKTDAEPWGRASVAGAVSIAEHCAQLLWHEEQRAELRREARWRRALDRRLGLGQASRLSRSSP